MAPSHPLSAQQSSDWPTTTTHPEKISVRKYPSTSSAFSSSAFPEEDWTKVSDLAERRRIQNRIAQRNYRKKMKERMAKGATAPTGNMSGSRGKKEGQKPMKKEGRRKSSQPQPGHHTLQPLRSGVSEYQSTSRNLAGKQPATICELPTNILHSQRRWHDHAITANHRNHRY